MSNLSLHLLSKDCLKRERRETVACTLEELVLELDPMKSESVKEALKGVHTHKHSESEREERKEQEEEKDAACGSCGFEGNFQNLLKEDCCKLGVGETQGPESEVRSRI